MPPTLMVQTVPAATSAVKFSTTGFVFADTTLHFESQVAVQPVIAEKLILIMVWMGWVMFGLKMTSTQPVCPVVTVGSGETEIRGKELGDDTLRFRVLVWDWIGRQAEVVYTSCREFVVPVLFAMRTVRYTVILSPARHVLPTLQVTESRVLSLTVVTTLPSHAFKFTALLKTISLGTTTLTKVVSAVSTTFMPLTSKVHSSPVNPSQFDIVTVACIVAALKVVVFVKELIESMVVVRFDMRLQVEAEKVREETDESGFVKGLNVMLEVPDCMSAVRLHEIVLLMTVHTGVWELVDVVKVHVVNPLIPITLGKVTINPPVLGTLLVVVSAIVQLAVPPTTLLDRANKLMPKAPVAIVASSALHVIYLIELRQNVTVKFNGLADAGNVILLTRFKVQPMFTDEKKFVVGLEKSRKVVKVCLRLGRSRVEVEVPNWEPVVGVITRVLGEGQVTPVGNTISMESVASPISFIDRLPIDIDRFSAEATLAPVEVTVQVGSQMGVFTTVH